MLCRLIKQSISQSMTEWVDEWMHQWLLQLMNSPLEYVCWLMVQNVLFKGRGATWLEDLGLQDIHPYYWKIIPPTCFSKSRFKYHLATYHYPFLPARQIGIWQISGYLIQKAWHNKNMNMQMSNVTQVLWQVSCIRPPIECQVIS